MRALTQLIREDMKPALGVTEPGAIALTVSTACSHLPAPAEKVELSLNSGIYKNAFTCGIPGTSHVGNAYAAALGALAADPEKGLLCLDGITEKQVKAAEAMVKAGKIAVHMSEITSRISIEARVSGGDTAAMTGALNNMASSITGMICDGGNQGCVMKGMTAVKMAFASAALAMDDAYYILAAHGINGPTPEETMKNMGRIASPGMTGTEKTIVDILQDKSSLQGEGVTGLWKFAVPDRRMWTPSPTWRPSASRRRKRPPGNLSRIG